MVAEAGVQVNAPPERVRAAVLDPDSYTQGDTKVGAVEVRERTADGLVALIHGSLGPVHSAILARYTIRGDDVDLQMMEGRLRGFHAVFRMSERQGGTWLVHREEYDFGYGPLGPVLDRALRGWALGTVRAEVEALRRAAERPPAASGEQLATAGRASAGPPSESPATTPARED
jgi:hypothetical protein